MGSSELNGIFEDCQRLFDAIADDVSGVLFDLNAQDDFFYSTYFSRIYELSFSAFFLLCSGHYSAAPIVLRSLCEAYVDLLNYNESCDYLHILVHGHLKDRAKKLRCVKSLDAVVDLGLVDRLVQENEEFLRRSREVVPHEDVAIYSKFKMAGLEEMYNSAYRYLSGSTHNQLSVIEDFHTVLEDGYRRVAVYKDIGKSLVCTYLDLAVKIVIISYFIINDKYLYGNRGRVEELFSLVRHKIESGLCD